VFNLAGRYQVNEGTQLWARIDNLFDEDYQEVEGFQTAGFSIYGGVRFKF
jgi:vitamin B12 transporter